MDSWCENSPASVLSCPDRCARDRVEGGLWSGEQRVVVTDDDDDDDVEMPPHLQRGSPRGMMPKDSNLCSCREILSS